MSYEKIKLFLFMLFSLRLHKFNQLRGLCFINFDKVKLMGKNSTSEVLLSVNLLGRNFPVVQLVRLL